MGIFRRGDISNAHGYREVEGSSRNKGLRWRAEVIEERSSENKRKGSLSLKSLVLFGRNWGPPGGFRAAEE